ncbi:MAG TPA: alpha/beta fold hydrolase, partial [Solirubrobacteraceae bacterium]|nr:alpha/beta fold hydrolase [Solirubrobacteraceae bacterium]
DVRSAPRGVLVVLAGGPGQPGVPFAVRARERLGAAARGRRLVLLDQRGTGGGALRCPALQRAMGTSDLAAPPAAAVRGCARLVGARRADYTTADTVADLDDLRRALRAPRLSLYGTSYGTFVAERYALAHPATTGRLVLDSVVPHAGVAALDVEGMRATARVLRDTCRTRRCPADPARDLAAVVRRRAGGVDGVALLDTLTALSIVAPEFRGVPEALHAAAAGAPRRLRRLVAAVARAQRAPASFLSQGLHAATLCAESRLPWQVDAPLAGRRAALARAGAALGPGATWPFDTATATGNGLVRQCLPWPPVPRPAPVAADLPPVPALLLAGDRDLSTPLAWAREEAAHAPRGELVVARGSGHGVLRQVRGGPVRRALERFLQAR